MPFLQATSWSLAFLWNFKDFYFDRDSRISVHEYFPLKKKCKPKMCGRSFHFIRTYDFGVSTRPRTFARGVPSHQPHGSQPAKASAIWDISGQDLLGRDPEWRDSGSPSLRAKQKTKRKENEVLILFYRSVCKIHFVISKRYSRLKNLALNPFPGAPALRVILKKTLCATRGLTGMWNLTAFVSYS